MVERTRWRVHVTVAGNFRLDEAYTIAVSVLLNSVANNTAAIDVRLWSRDRFGSERNIPVPLASHPASHPAFHRLHGRLLLG